jgi:hypothetical protein
LKGKISALDLSLATELPALRVDVVDPGIPS